MAELLSLGARQGNPTAQHALGFMYEAGEYFERDVSKAFDLYAAASRAGHLGASTNLGKLYQLGFGTERDLKKAVRLYREAAEGGIPAAQYLLGQAYAYGEGIERDLVEAYYWLSLASQQEQAQAPELLREVQQFLRGEEIAAIRSRIDAVPE